MRIRRINMSDRTAFGPSELKAMAAAFERALSEVASETGTCAELDCHGLRRRLAAGVVAAAKHGITDLEGLSTEALRALSRTPLIPPDKA